MSHHNSDRCTLRRGGTSGFSRSETSGMAETPPRGAGDSVPSPETPMGRRLRPWGRRLRPYRAKKLRANIPGKFRSISESWQPWGKVVEPETPPRRARDSAHRAGTKFRPTIPEMFRPLPEAWHRDEHLVGAESPPGITQYNGVSAAPGTTCSLPNVPKNLRSMPEA